MVTCLQALYANGKSAVRVMPGIRPLGPHYWSGPSHDRCSAWSVALTGAPETIFDGLPFLVLQFSVHTGYYRSRYI